MADKVPSENIKDFIRKIERFRAEAYKPTLKDVWTIGYGTTWNVCEGMTITEPEAEVLFQHGIKYCGCKLNKLVTVELNQNQYDALVSFMYNVGDGAVRKSTLLKLLNLGKYDAVPIELAKWHHQAGKDLEGLKKRRQAEIEIYNRKEI